MMPIFDARHKPISLDVPTYPQSASDEVVRAFANREAAKLALVVRAAGVDPDIAARLGYGERNDDV